MSRTKWSVSGNKEISRAGASRNDRMPAAQCRCRPRVPVGLLIRDEDLREAARGSRRDRGAHRECRTATSLYDEGARKEDVVAAMQSEKPMSRRRHDAGHGRVQPRALRAQNVRDDSCGAWSPRFWAAVRGEADDLPVSHAKSPAWHRFGLRWPVTQVAVGGLWQTDSAEC